MRLLSRQEVREATERLEDEATRRLQELNSLVAEKERLSNRTLTSIEEEKMAAERRYHDFVEDNKKKKTKLLQEIYDLESRKMQAENPMKAIQWQAKEDGVKRREESLARKMEELEQTKSSLYREKESIELRRKSLEEKEYVTAQKVSSLLTNEKRISDFMGEVKEERYRLETEKERQKASISIREERLREEQMEVNAAKEILKIEKEQLANAWTQLENERIHLESQQQTLKAARAELKL
jgi:hypothetical protein